MTVTAIPSADTEDDSKPRRRWVRFAIIGVVLLLILGGGAYLFLKPKGAADPNKAPDMSAGIALGGMQVNLAEGHYLRLGVTFQLTKTALAKAEASGLITGDATLDTSKAADAIIEVFSGLPIEQVDQATVRDSLKQKLADDIAQAYNSKAVTIYYTEFVTQ